MRNDDLARQDRMVVRHVCIWVSRSVLKLNFKPIPKSLDADPDAGRAYRRPDYFGFWPPTLPPPALTKDSGSRCCRSNTRA
jgi:hypothetical protein